MADDKQKLEGQRKAIRDHIDKYSSSTHDYDKDFALKTIRRAQHELAEILRKHPHWERSWEDEWSPGKSAGGF